MSVGSIVDELVGAVRFLTIVRLPRRPSGDTFGPALFPAVGLGIGMAVAGVDAILFAVPSPLRNVALVVVGVVLGGGMHQDGLADTLDALGGRDRADRLAIMRDASVGTFAVLGLVLAVGVRLSALGLLDGAERVPALLLSPALGRFSMVAVAFGAAAARPDGLGAAFLAAVDARAVVVATGTMAVAALLLGGWCGIVATVFAGAILLGVRSLSTRFFGGLTGDGLGATGEVVETLGLALFAVCWGSA